MPEQGRITLRPGRERSVLRRHPWIYSGAIASEECPDGAIADVHAADGSWLARGYYNSRSQIRVRILTWQETEKVGTSLWMERLERAVCSRLQLPELPISSAIRLVNAESDGLPGLVADLYIGQPPEDAAPSVAVLVCQFGTLGVDQRRMELARLLQEAVEGSELRHLFPWRRLFLYERSDLPERSLEGLPTRKGPIEDDEPPEELLVREGNLRLPVSVRDGHKTGAYLDQRFNRLRVARYCNGARVLDAFCYTGSFGLQALAAGAREVLALDSSRHALAIAARAVALNGLDAGKWQAIEGDALQELRSLRAKGARFDVVVLDPPKFAQHTSQVQAACRGYKDINLLAMQLLQPGGILVTFSCSGRISPDLFQKVVFAAACDAKRDVQVLEQLSQAPDHPILLTFPESRYLKGFICRVW
jgi:23S rRNA (cytosine1962-C5)-methyltransferase